MPGHKVNLSIVKQIEIISSIFSDHICSEIRNQLKEENVQKKKNLRKLNSMLLINRQITEEMRDIKYLIIVKT